MRWAVVFTPVVHAFREAAPARMRCHQRTLSERYHGEGYEYVGAISVASMRTLLVRSAQRDLRRCEPLLVLPTWSARALSFIHSLDNPCHASKHLHDHVKASCTGICARSPRVTRIADAVVARLNAGCLAPNAYV